MIIKETELPRVDKAQDFVYQVYKPKIKNGYIGEIVIGAKTVEHANRILTRYKQNNPQQSALTGVEDITGQDRTNEVSDLFGVARSTVKKVN